MVSEQVVHRPSPRQAEGEADAIEGFRKVVSKTRDKAVNKERYDRFLQKLAKHEELVRQREKRK